MSVHAFQIFSPHLLMLSGIGPAATLQQHDIEVISDLPGVGQNMWVSSLRQDIFASPYSQTPETEQHQCRHGHSRSLPPRPRHERPSPRHRIPHLRRRPTVQLQRRLLRSASPLPLAPITPFTNPPFSPPPGFEKLPNSTRSALPPRTLAALSAFPADWPEVEYLLTSSPRRAAPSGKAVASIAVALTAALSRGNVTLASASPLDLPLVTVGAFAAEADRHVAVAAVKRAREAWRGVSEGVRGEEVFPGRGVTTDEGLWEGIRERAGPVHHVAATCESCAVLPLVAGL